MPNPFRAAYYRYAARRARRRAPNARDAAWQAATSTPNAPDHARYTYTPLCPAPSRGPGARQVCLADLPCQEHGIENALTGSLLWGSTYMRKEPRP